MLTSLLLGSFILGTVTIVKTVFGTLCFMASMYDEDSTLKIQDEYGANSLIENDIFLYEPRKIYLLHKIAS